MPKMSDIDSYAARRKPTASIGDLLEARSAHLGPLPGTYLLPQDHLNDPMEFTTTRERLTPQNRSIGPNGGLITETDNTLPQEPTDCSIEYCNTDTPPRSPEVPLSAVQGLVQGMYSSTLRHNGKGTTLKLRYAVLALWISMTNPRYSHGWQNSIQAAIYRLASSYPKEKSTSGLSGYVMDCMCLECDNAWYTQKGAKETARFQSILEELLEEK